MAPTTRATTGGIQRAKRVPKVHSNGSGAQPSCFIGQNTTFFCIVGTAIKRASCQCNAYERLSIDFSTVRHERPLKAGSEPHHSSTGWRLERRRRHTKDSPQHVGFDAVEYNHHCHLQNATTTGGATLGLSCAVGT